MAHDDKLIVVAFGWLAKKIDRKNYSNCSLESNFTVVATEYFTPESQRG
jgi:hypothetical protein